jgi:hypothetical protein
MAYYDALIAKWATLTPGTTAAKLAQLNAMTVSGSVPTSFYVTGNQLLNCINYAEFKVLTAQQQSNILAVCRVPGQLLGGSANTAFIVDGMILDYFPVAGPTIAALTALAQATVQPWWLANGYTSPFTQPDLTAAGNLT